MSVDRYRLLLSSLCQQLRISDASSLMSEGRLVVEGTETALAHEGDSSGGKLWISIDLGAVPANSELRVYREMMRTNLVANGVDVGMLTLQANGRAALVVRRSLTHEFDARQLAHTLLRLVDFGRRWAAYVVAAPESGNQQ